MASEESLFWNEIGTEHFATEEEYSHGLTAYQGSDEFEQVQWLGFYLGKEEYALDLEVVSELIKPRTLTELPQVPAYICGIITLRGEVIPVVDLHIRLGLQYDQPSDGDLQRIVICDGPDQKIGLLVDRISQVVRLPVENVETPHLLGENPAIAYIQGVGRSQGRMLIQLRPEKVIEIESIVGI
jgi:purine-binding chemotaxis protein CheW